MKKMNEVKYRVSRFARDNYFPVFRFPIQKSMRTFREGLFLSSLATASRSDADYVWFCSQLWVSFQTRVGF